ncbi:helix-turn-helix domain-containing protein [Tenacibaculum sp.]|uniref:helix-turn-helix domain-containing protein n=1 Tax=Tenacibaculum sp. TaxID=1906242 RepID=UPI003D134271
MFKGKEKYSDDIKPYVKDIFVFEEKDSKIKTSLPFFADGYPGIIFCVSSNGLFLKHKNKRLSEFFLYGQTINPIELYVEGAYKMIVFQMLPSAVRILLGVEPKILNDDCYDLTQLSETINQRSVECLNKTNNTKEQVKIVSKYLTHIIEKSTLNTDKSIVLAINIVLQCKGKITVTELRKKLFLTERTLERRFVKEIGVTPKIFCKIIQFQNSLIQISDNENNRMIDVAYENGFSDQSHFIKTFKKYAGVTPSEFQYLPALANFLQTTD